MLQKKYILTILVVTTLAGTACGCLPLAVPQPVVENHPTVTEQNSEPATGLAQSGAAVPQPSEAVVPVPASTSLTYPIVDTDQVTCYDDMSATVCPNEGRAYYGQDAQYAGNQPRYQDNRDGTITDLVTGLIWQQDPGEKVTYDRAAAGGDSLTLGGYTDWRLPGIKELYSLIQFDGTDTSRCADEGACTSVPFIDTNYFNFAYGNTASGERMIDSQWATSSIYTGSVMNGQRAMFGVNFADGRIKGYPTNAGRTGSKTFFVIYVRGNTGYGINDFVDNGIGTITDNATGLTWMQSDSGAGLDWESALNYCASLEYAGASDWRLPNAKELQSIVDYSRSPDVTNSAAIDPLFNTSTIINEAGQLDYPAFWSSTTHANSDGMDSTANYVTFGRAMGNMNNTWMDVHGAGAQRSEFKSGDPSRYSSGHGPQGDAVRIYNYARCVTGGASKNATDMSGQVPNGQDVQGPQGQLPGNTGRPDLTAAAAQPGFPKRLSKPNSVTLPRDPSTSQRKPPNWVSANRY
ncbi:MAG: DUF1566 domain-containing protein [Anaerolineales bacterium]|nr:DUF1566 domain-containing protein [Anaerolineales bacterium]